MWILCLGFTWNIVLFLWKTMKKYLWMSSAGVVIGALKVKVFYELLFSKPFDLIWFKFGIFIKIGYDWSF